MANHNNYWLCFNNFDEKIKRSWQQLQNCNDFHDVTLACEDGQIKTHKIIISSCSPVLLNILKLNQNPYPLINLRKFKYQNLQNLLTFMYQGEVDVAEENLPSFLEVANYLKVSGVSEESKENLENTFQLPLDNIISPLKREEKELCKNVENFIDHNNISRNNDHTDAFLQDYNFDDNGIVLENKSEDKIFKEEKNCEDKQNIVLSNLQKKWPCKKCGKNLASQGSLLTHVRSVHDGIRHTCKICNYKATTLGHLRTHVAKVHNGLRHPCNMCDYKATATSSLKLHVESIHKGFRHPCNQCDYKATQITSLRKHIESIHEKISYNCSKCDIKTKSHTSLKIHIESIHDGVCYPCNQCHHIAKGMRNLKTHVRLEHS